MNNRVALVSIIIPAYRVTAYIAEALDSVLAQTFTDWEAIVVNDGCPDTANLERVLDPYQSRIRYLKLAKNGGVAGARNAGIQASQARYIAFLDADDVWEPNYLQIHAGMLEADPNLDVVYGNSRIFGPTSENGRLSMDLLPSIGEVNFASLVCLRCNVHASATARRETLVRVGMFDVRQRRCEDIDLWLRIARAGGRFAYHHQVVLRYRKRDVSQSSDSRVSLTAMIEYYEKLKREFSLTAAEIELVDRQKRSFQAQLDVVEGKLAFDEGRTPEALEHLKRAQQFYKTQKLQWVILSMRIAPGLVRWARRRRDRVKSW